MFKHYMNPPFVYISYWLFFTISPVLALRGAFNWNYYGLTWILISCILFYYGSLIGKTIIVAISKKSILDYEKKYKVSVISWKVIITFILIGLSHTFFNVIRNGFSFGMFLDLDSLFIINHTMANRRFYGGSSTYSYLSQITLVFVYTSSLCGGYNLVYSNNLFKRLICITTFLPILARLLLTNEKAGLIGCLILFICSFLVSHMNLYKKPPKISFRSFIKSVLGVILFLSLLYASMILRIGDYNHRISAVVNQKFLTYSFSSLPNFDSWYNQFNNNNEYHYGTYTAFGIFNFLNITKRQLGVYSEKGVKGSNVYTAFRGIIHDFGKIGGLFLIFFVGIISGLSYYYVLFGGRQNIFLILVLIVIYSFIFYSFIISILTYMTYIISYFLFTTILLLSKKTYNTEVERNFFPQKGFEKKRQLYLSPVASSLLKSVID